MANRLLQTLAENYCCVHRFLEKNVIGREVEEAADALGVTTRTITNYRRRFKEKEVYICPRCVERRAQLDAEPDLKPGSVIHQYPGAKRRESDGDGSSS